MERVDDEILNKSAESYQVVKHRAEKAQKAIDQAAAGMDQLLQEINILDSELDDLLSQADALLDGNSDFMEEDQKAAEDMLRQVDDHFVPVTRYKYEKLETINSAGSWEQFIDEVENYARKNGLELKDDPFDGLLTQSERDRIGEKIRTDYIVAMDPDERKSAIETYLSYGPILAAVVMGESVDQKDQINRLCEMTSELLHQYVHINPEYNHKDFLKKPDTLNEWFLYFNRYYPELFESMPISAGEFVESEDAVVEAVRKLAKLPTWAGFTFSLIYQFVLTDEQLDTGNDFVIIDMPEGPELEGKTTTFKLIAGFVNWMDALCKSSSKYKRTTEADNDVRELVMAILEKCGFGESDQEGIVRTIQEYAIDVYNVMADDDRQINKKSVQIGVCNYVMKFLSAVQNRAKGMPFSQTIDKTEESFVCRCQVVGYGMIDILKKSMTLVGKADVISPIYRLVNSVDVDGWVEFTYESLAYARAVYRGYYINLEKMDADLEEDWKELLDSGITVSRRI